MKTIFQHFFLINNHKSGFSKLHTVIIINMLLIWVSLLLAFDRVNIDIIISQQYNRWWRSLKDTWASHIGGAWWSIHWVFKNWIKDGLGEETWEFDCSSDVQQKSWYANTSLFFAVTPWNLKMSWEFMLLPYYISVFLKNCSLIIFDQTMIQLCFSGIFPTWHIMNFSGQLEKTLLIFLWHAIESLCNLFWYWILEQRSRISRLGPCGFGTNLTRTEYLVGVSSSS